MQKSVLLAGIVLLNVGCDQITYREPEFEVTVRPTPAPVPKGPIEPFPEKFPTDKNTKTFPGQKNKRASWSTQQVDDLVAT